MTDTERLRQIRGRLGQLTPTSALAAYHEDVPWLLEQLVETKAELLYTTWAWLGLADEDILVPSWAEVADATKAQYRQEARRSLGLA
jgi:hypothetical protein